MSRDTRISEQRSGTTDLDLSHLRRQTRTALELAVAALAPTELIDALAVVAGLLEAVEELPRDSPPVVALVPHLMQRSRKALERWNSWHAEHLGKVTV